MLDASEEVGCRDSCVSHFVWQTQVSLCHRLYSSRLWDIWYPEHCCALENADGMGVRISKRHADSLAV